MNKPTTDDLFKQAIEQEKISLDFGFYWENIGQILDQIRSECDEIQEAWAKGNTTHLQEEIGDVISAAISLAIFCKIDPITTLKENIEKYQDRFDHLVSLVKNDNLKDLKGQPMDVLLSYWNKAKSISQHKNPLIFKFL